MFILLKTIISSSGIVGLPLVSFFVLKGCLRNYLIVVIKNTKIYNLFKLKANRYTPTPILNV